MIKDGRKRGSPSLSPLGGPSFSGRVEEPVGPAGQRHKASAEWHLVTPDNTWSHADTAAVPVGAAR